MLDKIKSLCAARGVTIKDLEQSLGFGRNTVFRWDKSSPSSEKVKKVADFFGVPVSYFYDDESNLVTYTADSEYAQIVQRLIERPELRTLFRASENATKEDIEAVVRLLNRDGQN